MTTDLTGSWNYPAPIWCGPGRISELPAACREQGMERPLVVTDPGVAALPMLGTITGLLAEAGLGASVFSGVRPNPVGDDVAAGVRAFHAGDCDGVVALGGGSPMDVAKAVALMSGHAELPVWAFEDIGDNWTRADPDEIAPIVAIPTTAGTGSEVGRCAVIVDQEEHRKVILFHPRLMPGRVIADPELTVGLSPRLTAATGMDALAHNLEALCAPGFHPMADGVALEGIRLIAQALPRAVRDGTDLEARGHMLIASTMGATAFQKGLGVIHSISHPVGALYDTHHGLTNAVVMPYGLDFNRAYVGPQMARLGRVLDLAQPDVDGVLEWILALRAEVGIPANLGELGVPVEAAGQIAQMALADPTAGTNPRPLELQAVTSLTLRTITGAG